MEFLSTQRLESGNSRSLIFGVHVLMFEVENRVTSAKESSTFISVPVCYSLAFHAVVELLSVDNLPNVVHHFFQSVLPASKGE